MLRFFEKMLFVKILTCIRFCLLLAGSFILMNVKFDYEKVMKFIFYRPRLTSDIKFARALDITGNRWKISERKLQ